jgi:hypothetical protein
MFSCVIAMVCYTRLKVEERKMSLRVIEGTWEEVMRHDAELTGRHVKVTIMPEKQFTREPKASATPSQPKKLVGYGMFKDMFGGTEALFAEKKEEIELEERKFEQRP